MCSLLLISSTEFIIIVDVIITSDWCRSVVKSGGQGQSCQAFKLFQITPYVSDSKHSTIPVPNSL